MLHKDVMAALKNYNYSKIIFLFDQIKKTTNLDLAKSVKKMSEEEKQALWYGLWERTFYEPKKGSYYSWKGLVFLIQKYMRSSKSSLKENFHASIHKMLCPICKGTILFHNRLLLIKGVDIRELLKAPVSELAELFPAIPIIGRLSAILPQGTRSNTDISSLCHGLQVRLKLFEIAERAFYGLDRKSVV